MRRALLTLVAGAILGAGLTGCGRDIAEYTGSQACGVETSTIVDLIGTQNFRVSPSTVGLPIDDAGAVYRCSLDFRDDVRADLTVEITSEDQLGIDTSKDAVAKISPFDVVDGQGVGGVYPQDPEHDAIVSALWVCGAVTGRIRATVEDWNETSARTLTEQLAQAAGCAT